MNLPDRKATRLKGYDYSTPGAYFVTICSNDKSKIFGYITGGDMFHQPEMAFSQIGIVIIEELMKIETYYKNIVVEKFTVMPNHIHLIIRITHKIESFSGMSQYDISNVVGKFKASVTRKIRKSGLICNEKIWQSSFHDHIIRDEKDYQRIWQYIDNNPAKWKYDCFYIE